MKLLVAVLCIGLFYDIAYCQSGLIFCIPKAGSNGEEFLKIMSLQIPETRTEQCLKACVMKAMNTMTDDNKLNTDGTGPYLSLIQQKKPDVFDRIMEIYKECQLDNPSGDECTAAYEYSKCINPKLKDLLR